MAPDARVIFRQQLTVAAVLLLLVFSGCNFAPTPAGDADMKVKASAASVGQPHVEQPTGAPANVSHGAAIDLRDVTARTQIAFRHTDGNSGNYYLVETVASGLATFDYDDDGLVDIYFLNGIPLKGAGPDAPPGGNALYRNLGALRFQDVTQQAGVGQAGYGLGVAAGDYNNDGHQDLYVSNFGPKVLYQNNGDGTFTDVTLSAGVANGNRLGAGASFLDIDNDGWLDLYVANYVDFAYEKHVTRFITGIATYQGPMDWPPMQNMLYRNRGDGTFKDATESSGVDGHPGTGMGMISTDYDNDGDVDILVANDNNPNFCFRNDGTGKFTEVAAVVGLAFNRDGMVRSNMGIDSADYDHDGWFDFFVTTYQREFPVLYHSQGDGIFRDVTAKAAQTQRSYNNSKWGCGFADFDNDGWKDIFVGIGHLQVNIEQYDKSSAYAARPMLLRNNGKGKFEDVTDTSGDGLKVMCVARGVALEDLDNDGRVDVVISNSRRAPVILRNESQNSHHWLELKLKGVKVNRDAVGARVKVTSGDLVQIDEVHSGRGYQSHFGTRLHFGLGMHERIDEIEVRWPGGFKETWTDIRPDQILTLTEGGGKSAS